SGGDGDWSQLVHAATEPSRSSSVMGLPIFSASARMTGQCSCGTRLRSFQPCTVVTATPTARAVLVRPPKASITLSAGEVAALTYASFVRKVRKIYVRTE